MTLLWLDDVRNPFRDDWLLLSCFPSAGNVAWVKSYSEFVEWIQINGLPDGVAFDHDLGIEYHWEETHPKLSDGVIAPEHKVLYDKFKDELTGYHCAKWLTEYCMDNRLHLPKWSCHSANWQGRQNIESLLQSFEKIINYEN